jgi:hypothetical protein
MTNAELLRKVAYALDQARGCTGGDELTTFVGEFMKLLTPQQQTKLWAALHDREENCGMRPFDV